MSASSPSPPEPNPYAPPAPAMESHAVWTSESVIDSLGKTRPWVLLFSILGFIAAAILAFIGLRAAAYSFGEPNPFEAGQALGGALMILLLGVLYFFPSVHLLRFAGRIRDLTYTRQLVDLERALSAQKSFWRFCGIAFSTVIGIYLLILLGAVAVAVFQMLQ